MYHLRSHPIISNAFAEATSAETITVLPTEMSCHLSINALVPSKAQTRTQTRDTLTNPLDSLFDQGWGITTHYRFAKRALDLVLALLLLPPALILLFLLTVLIWCTCGWPVFYLQWRVGLHGRPFLIYKLRTMKVSADRDLRHHPMLAHTWQQCGKLRHDPRITWLGRWLRRTSLDELPQIFNILRGEMSLVGPRPIQFSELARFGPFGALRHMVKPGLTGFWQIYGRSRLGYEQRCFYDCLYILKGSLAEDLRILVRTLPAILSGKGAY